MALADSIGAGAGSTDATTPTMIAPIFTPIFTPNMITPILNTHRNTHPQQQLVTPIFTLLQELPANRFSTGDIVLLSAAVTAAESSAASSRGGKGKKKKDKAKGRPAACRVDPRWLADLWMNQRHPSHPPVLDPSSCWRTAGGSAARVAEGLRGLVSRKQNHRIEVALDAEPEGGLPDLCRLDKMGNDVTYKRMRAALASLTDVDIGSPAAAIVDVAFGKHNPKQADLEQVEASEEIEALNSNLNASQMEAVAFAMASRDVALIHGPPGTGKTTTVVELIRQELRRNPEMRILCTAPSNAAIDNVVERLVAADPSLAVVRLGHPARLLPAVLGKCLDALVADSDEGDQVREMKAELR